jgi:hypothetical protein
MSSIIVAKGGLTSVLDEEAMDEMVPLGELREVI